MQHVQLPAFFSHLSIQLGAVEARALPLLLKTQARRDAQTKFCELQPPASGPAVSQGKQPNFGLPRRHPVKGDPQREAARSSWAQSGSLASVWRKQRRRSLRPRRSPAGTPHRGPRGPGGQARGRRKPSAPGPRLATRAAPTRQCSGRTQQWNKHTLASASVVASVWRI